MEDKENDSKSNNVKSRFGKFNFGFGKKEKNKEPKIEETPEIKTPNTENTQKQTEAVKTLLEPAKIEEHREKPSYRFEDFVDERTLVSHDIFGKKEMKIKVLEVSDEHPPVQWKFGDRVKVSKILVTIKHLESQKVEEGEFDIDAIEKELAEKRHYTSTNRWVPTNEIKNGYVIASRHTSLISDAAALDYITF